VIVAYGKKKLRNEKTSIYACLLWNGINKFLVWNCPSDGDDYDLWLMELKIVLPKLTMNHQVITRI